MLFILLFIPALILVYLLPGYLILGFLKVKLKLAEKIALSFIVGSVASAFLIFLSTMIFPWSAASLWFLVIIFNLALWLAHHRFVGKVKFLDDPEDQVTPANQYYRRFIWLIAIVIGLIFLIGGWEFKDSVGTWHTTVIGDNDKHFAMVASLMNADGFPAKTVASSLSSPVLVSYYYFFYLLIAAVAEMTGRAMIVANLLAIIGGLNLIAGFILLPLTAASLLPGKKIAALVALLPFVAGFQIIPLVNSYFVGQLIPFLSVNDDMSALPIMSLAHAVGWIPQHLAGLFIVFLIIFLLGQAKNRFLTFAFLGLATAVLAATSFFIFAALAISGIFYLLYLFVKKEFVKSVLPIGLFLVFFGICFLIVSQAVFGGVEQTYFGDMFSFLVRDPVGKNEIFGLKVATVNFPARIYWTILYYFERLGLILPLGVAGLFYFRKQIFQNINLALLVIVGTVTIFSNLFIFLPGGQNEFSKYGSMLYFVMFAILAAALIDRLIDRYQNYCQHFKVHKIKRHHWFNLSLINIGWLIIVIAFALNLASGWWSYYFGIFSIKIKHSADPPRNQLAEANLWIRKNTDKDDILSIHPQFATLITSYGERRVLAGEKLGAFPAASQKQFEELEETVASLKRFDANGFNQAAYTYLKEHRVKYIVTGIFDGIFSKRDGVVDRDFFQEVYQDKTSAIYRLN